MTITIQEAWRELREATGGTSSTLDSLTRQCLREVLDRSVESMAEEELRRLHAQLYSDWGQNTADHAFRTLRSILAYGTSISTTKKIERSLRAVSDRARYRIRHDGKVIAKIPTLGEVWDGYSRVRHIKYNTLKTYSLNLHSHLGDWMNRPIDSFTKSQVIERHRLLTQRHGPGAANITMRVFRALCNYALAVCEDSAGKPVMSRNPAMVLKEAMLWNPCEPRTRHLSPSEFPKWWQAVQRIENKTTTDFLAFCLFTGCRSSEARNLKWSSVFLEDNCVVFEKTKNGKDHRLPVCSQVASMLTCRKQIYGGYFVFPQSSNPLKPYDYKHHSTKLIADMCGITASPHDLRRTYATVCSTLRFDTLLIGRLLNHSDRGVTERYIMRSLEPFRDEIQKVGDVIERLLGNSKMLPVRSAIPDTVHQLPEEKI